MTTLIDPVEMDLAEQFASIRRQMAQIAQSQGEVTRFVTELSPWKTMTSGMMFGAALVATTVMFTKHFV